MTPLDSAVLEAFEALQQRLSTFSQQLKQDKPRCWLPGSPADLSIHARLAELYSDIWYIDGSDGRTTRSQCGLVAGSPQLLDLANLVNQAKTHFKQTVIAYHASEGKYPDTALKTRAKALAEALNREGLARLHLKQCYRHIPVLEFTPTKVGFNWYCSGRSIKRLSVEAVMRMLQKMDTGQPHIEIQLQVLASLPPDEPLAQLQTQAPVVRANLQWSENGVRQRRALNCALPLLFPLRDGDEFPIHNEIASAPPEVRERKERSDLRIEPIPLLPGLRIHRYKA